MCAIDLPRARAAEAVERCSARGLPRQQHLRRGRCASCPRWWSSSGIWTASSAALGRVPDAVLTSARRASARPAPVIGPEGADGDHGATERRRLPRHAPWARPRSTARATPRCGRSTGSTSSSRPARFTAIMGPSGSGKSTLMQCMAGLDRLTSGRDLDRRRRVERAVREADHHRSAATAWASSSRPSTWSRPSTRSRTSGCRWTSPGATPRPTGWTRSSMRSTCGSA